MSGHGSKLNRKMDVAIAALLVHRNLDEAAHAAGISVATLRRWQELPEFDAAYRKACRQGFRQQVARLQQASSAAVSALFKLVAEPSSPPAVKARAAYYILTLATKAIEVDDIEHRVTELERAAESKQQ